jgi:hypothetical protein
MGPEGIARTWALKPWFLLSDLLLYHRYMNVHSTPHLLAPRNKSVLIHGKLKENDIFF